MEAGIFTISLDFELYWGVHDQIHLKDYWDNLKNTPKAVNGILDLFDEYDITATWAVVDVMRFEDRETFLRTFPNVSIPYEDKNKSPFPFLEKTISKAPDEFLFAKEIIQRIEKTKGQEVGTHTFSHFYCLEKGVSSNDLKNEFEWVRILRQGNNDARTIVFPRNQYNIECLKECEKAGIKAYRGNPKLKCYDPIEYEKNGIVSKAMRWKDSFFGSSDHLLHNLKRENNGSIHNVPASLFFRPYKRYSLVQKIKLNRIRSLMRKAAREKRLFHLWWHPHNFGNNFEKNLTQLRNLLKFYKGLEREYSMENKNMGQIVTDLSDL